ncbi:MAG: D-alanyl-D-alanine carboxypeptidase [Desulfobacteraceae bacterium]
MENLRLKAAVFILVLSFFFFIPGQPANGAESDQGPGVLLATPKGEIVYARNPNKQFIPASTLKLITSLGAFYYLGEAFTFHTDFFLDRRKNLVIKGYGDPLLTSEVIAGLCRTLAEKLKKEKRLHLNDIVIDDSYFETDLAIPGRSGSVNPYDAPAGALCANFNTIFFRYSPEKQQFVSGEKQTPLLDFARETIRASGLKTGRVPLSKQASRIYAGLLFKHFLERKGIRVTGQVKTGKTLPSTPLFFRYRSPFPLTGIVEKLLQFSNNFMANQLLLTMGAVASGPPATLEKGVNAMNRFAVDHLKLSRTIIAEGSGLSRQNRTTPNDMLKVLMAFQPYHRLMETKKTAQYKTGTLNGVRTRAGYFSGKKSRLYPFVIMVNGKNSGCMSISEQLQDRVNRHKNRRENKKQGD